MKLIDQIIAKRQSQKKYNEKVWDFMEGAVIGRNLINLSDLELQDRLNSIELNIQYLDTGSTPRDNLEPSKGWLSPWWWLQARHWTLREFKHRSLIPDATREIAQMPELANEMKGLFAGGQRILVRISSLKRLMDTLRNGTLRFVTASSYRDSKFDSARQDDELIRTSYRPNHAVRISDNMGRIISPIGEIKFTLEHSLQGEEHPYWICCFSSDLDPRLFGEFKSDDSNEDACIVIFNPIEFIRRSQNELNLNAPFTLKKLTQVNYFDPYYIDRNNLSVVDCKDFSYANQREFRFILIPEYGPLLTRTEPLVVNIGSISDISGVYATSGKKISGFGPENFLV
ncbi:hypothetical protein [Yersinia wautersii]|uniref:Uncharacterized protein n=1 Tax=Yersinia wautersii TaxID=1341643 RepID=A0ABP1ZLA7_9GAMM|nr:hypothetical protein [Yersinia wautersii]CRG52251.1 Uncharacterised protein [Yersinia wautersii]